MRLSNVSLPELNVVSAELPGVFGLPVKTPNGKGVEVVAMGFLAMKICLQSKAFRYVYLMYHVLVTIF
jgi:hypothetical protein